MADIYKAIYNTHNTAVTINGNTQEDITVLDNDGNEVTIDWTQVNAWTDPEQYKYDRVKEYPDIGDQLDDLFKAGAFSTEMTATLQAVKDKYPKE
jgi:hypothetical protein